MNPKLLEIKLPQAVSYEIATFWKTHGALHQAMLSQPVARDGGYTLKLRMLSVSEASQVNAALRMILGPK